MRIKHLLILFVILILIISGIFYYFLSTFKIKEIYEIEFKKYTQNTLEIFKYGVEVSLESENYESLSRIVNWTNNQNSVLLTAVTTIDDQTETILASNPENLIIDPTYINKKSRKFNVSKDTIYQTIAWESKDLKGNLYVAFSNQNFLNEVSKSSYQTVISLIIFILLFSIVAIFVANYLSRPILNLTQIATQISSGNESLRAQTNLGGKDVGLLAQSFNTMLDKLKELENKRIEEYTNWNRILENKNEQIVSSIRYAETIQKSFLTQINSKFLKFFDYFLIYLPKDIISGDFYWIKEIEGNFYIIIADCTGHGVPGAMIGTMGNIILNDLILRDKILEPNLILENLDKNIINVLAQDKGSSFSQDGMDIGVLRINPSDRLIQYSGAFRPLFIMDDAKLTEIKGDKFHIGGFLKKIKYFSLNTLEYSENLKFYISSDGYSDQIGQNGKKFGTKYLKSAIEEISNMKFSEQKMQLENLLDTHTGSEDQRDDITILGFGFK